MRPIENGLVLDGARELHHAQFGVAVLGEQPTINYLTEVEQRVILDLYARALAGVRDEDITNLLSAAVALGERYPREEDAICDIASGQVVNDKKTVPFPVTGEHAKVVIDGLNTLNGSCTLNLLRNGVNKKMVRKMLREFAPEQQVTSLLH